MPVKRASKRSSKQVRRTSKKVRRISKKVRRTSHKGGAKQVRRTSKKVRRISKRGYNHQKGGKNGKLLLKNATNTNSILLTKADYDFAHKILKNIKTNRPEPEIMRAANIVLEFDRDMYDFDEKVITDSEIEAIKTIIVLRNTPNNPYA